MTPEFNEALKTVAPYAAAAVSLIIAVISVGATSAAGGPRRTRKSKRLLDQTMELSAQPAKEDLLSQAASIAHSDALLRELARIAYPAYRPLGVAIFGMAYLGMGIVVRLSDDEPVGSTIMSAVGCVALLLSALVFENVLSNRRRVCMESGEASPLLTNRELAVYLLERQLLLDRSKIVYGELVQRIGIWNLWWLMFAHPNYAFHLLFGQIRDLRRMLKERKAITPQSPGQETIETRQGD